MSNNNNKPQTAINKPSTVVSEIAEGLPEGLVKEQEKTPLLKAVQLCLRLLLLQSVNGRSDRGHESEIKEAIASLE